ncbi:pheromone A receptor-domain-containing protein [Amylostereum chailletii]|nr:pheromone A receptor-domain-containing protein [Amylostereum chailletii]
MRRKIKLEDLRTNDCTKPLPPSPPPPHSLEADQRTRSKNGSEKWYSYLSDPDGFRGISAQWLTTLEARRPSSRRQKHGINGPFLRVSHGIPSWTQHIPSSLSLIQGFGTIIWSDDADNIAPVWCDISSHLGLAVGVGIPACSLVITRRLCNIVCMRTINGRKRERYIQYFLVGFPIIVAGPFYHIVQASRFVVTGELGCSAAVIASRSTTMLMDVWPVVLPLLSAMIYCPRIIWTFYRQRRDVDAFLHGNGSIDHTRYFRILAVGCLDTVFTLPTGILLIVPGVAHDVNAGHGGYSFYPGWYFADHSDHPWAPQSISPAAWRSDFWVRFGMIFGEWVNLVLSILIFVLFGLTGEARAFYRRWFWAAVGLFRSKPPVHEDMPDMKFNSPPRHRVRSVGYVIVPL